MRKLSWTYLVRAPFIFPVLLVLLKVVLVFVLAIPFLLPEMHEHYFYLVDVISIVAALYFPRTFYIAVGIQLCSLLSYASYLLNTQIIALTYVAFIVLVLVIITTADLVFTLYPGLHERIIASAWESSHLSLIQLQSLNAIIMNVERMWNGCRGLVPLHPVGNELC